MEFECKNFMDKLMVILRGIGLIALYMVVTPLLLVALYALPISENISYLIAEILTMIILMLLFFRRFKRDFKDFKSNYKKYLKECIIYWIIGFIGMMLSNLVINLVISDGALAANETANREMLSAIPITSIISMCIIAPICEELLFRASFKNAFKSIVLYSLFTGIFFAAMHVATGFDSLSISAILKNWKELLYLIPYSSVGIAFGYSFYKTNNIFTSISLHAIHNSLTVFMILFASLGGA